MERIQEKFKGKKLPFYQEVDGFRLPGVFSPSAFRSALAYKPRPDDLFIVTYPKCGTTWVQTIVACIYRDGKPFQSALEFFSQMPFLEMAGAEAAETMKRPGAIKFHLPYYLTPMSSEAKYIFVARNPKDCCVSFYHFTESIAGYQFQGGEFDVFFELFIEGETAYGDYFDCLLSWYEHRNDPNVLFLTYEEMKKDPKAHVLKIAEFMGQKYKDALETDDGRLLQDVLYHSSFAFMKEHLNRHIDELSKLPKEVILGNPDVPPNLKKLLTGERKVFNPEAAGSNLVRKGVVGDWRNYFTKEQNDRMDKKFQERMARTDLPEIWKDAMALVASKEKREKKILPEYQETRCGFRIAKMFSIDAFESALNYRPRPDDLFIVTYPKCGTTWVQNIVACIFREGKPFESALEFLSNTPFLEMAGAEAAETMKRPGAIKLHLPFQYTPWSDQAKYLFVARNPKDCCVSFYHHTRNLVGYKFKNGSFDDYFELFMQGKVDFGDYFDCLMSWYEHRNDPNVLFITYEQLKKDTRANVLKIASFMGGKYKDMLENDEKILDAVLKYSSFDFMKKTLNKQIAELAALPRDYVLNHPDIPEGLKTLLGAGDTFFDSDPNSVSFVRRGIVGDWKNHFSADQNRRLEEKFKERTKGTDIPELWKDDM